MSDIVLAGGVETMDRVQPIASGDERNLGQIQTARVMSREMLPTSGLGDRSRSEQRWYQRRSTDHGHVARPPRSSHVSVSSPAKLRPFALESHKRASARKRRGSGGEIQPGKIEYTDGSKQTVDTDQNPREDTTLEN